MRPIVVYALAVFTLAALAVWYQFNIWAECRDFGHSIFYCLRMLTK